MLVRKTTTSPCAIPLISVTRAILCELSHAAPHPVCAIACMREQTRVHTCVRKRANIVHECVCMTSSQLCPRTKPEHRGGGREGCGAKKLEV